MSNHKIDMLRELVKQMGDRSVNRLKSRGKPMVSIHVEKHADEQPEESLLHEKMESPLNEHNEDNELSIAGDDVEGRRAMMKRFSK